MFSFQATKLSICSIYSDVNVFTTGKYCCVNVTLQALQQASLVGVRLVLGQFALHPLAAMTAESLPQASVQAPSQTFSRWMTRPALPVKYLGWLYSHAVCSDIYPNHTINGWSMDGPWIHCIPGILRLVPRGLEGLATMPSTDDLWMGHGFIVFLLEGLAPNRPDLLRTGPPNSIELVRPGALPPQV